MKTGLADKVYKRDGQKCRHCESRDNLTPHHVIFRSQQGKDAMNNLITLCVGCHNALHAGKLKLEIRDLLENDLIVRFERVKGWVPQ